MSDTPTPETAAAPAAPTATFSKEEVEALVTAAVAAHQSAQPAAPAAPPAPAPLTVGQRIVHRWTDPTGKKEAHGLIVAIAHDEGAEDRAQVAWLNLSGLIPVSDLEAVEEL